MAPPTNEFVSSINVKYTAKRTIGHGGYGVVYMATDHERNNVAVKLQKEDLNNSEVEVLRNVQHFPHFCRFIDSGTLDDQGFLVMELIGPNLLRIKRELPKKQFAFSSAIRLSMQCLHALEQLHSVGFISRDVKSSNFAVGLPGNQQRLVRMIDFGITCRAVRDEEEDASQSGWRGTSRYCSLATHRQEEPSKRDDIESWFYMSVELLNGDLPWSGLTALERKQIERQKITARTLHRRKFLGKTPKQFDEILDVVDVWSADTEPDYDGLFVTLHECAKEKKVVFNEPYDWEDLAQYVNGRMMMGML